MLVTSKRWQYSVPAAMNDSHRTLSISLIVGLLSFSSINFPAWCQIGYGQPPETAAESPPLGSQQAPNGGYANYSLPPYQPRYGAYPPPPQPGYNPYGGGQTPAYRENSTYSAQPAYGLPSAYGYGTGYGLPSQAQTGISIAAQGLNIPLSLTTAISTQVAKNGDFVQATTSSNVPLSGYAYIPAGTTVTGQITDAEAGRRLSRSGALSISFNQMRLPSGATIPITAHLVGSIGRYKDVGQGGQDLYRGEGWGTKLGQLALRGGLGAGLGAGLGTAVGAIGGGGHGAGMGAWSGAAIGGGIGGLDMLLRKGKDVLIPSGTAMQLQLDAPAQIPGPGAPAEYAQPIQYQPQFGGPPPYGQAPQYNQAPPGEALMQAPPASF
ncbi:MAG: hypothetical protein IT342_19335 [Candidatus Melainabacteria bacterium]|nr:hypothetical protein [Candidatus Melainabacteria bacterium]